MPDEFLGKKTKSDYFLVFLHFSIRYSKSHNFSQASKQTKNSKFFFEIGQKIIFIVFRLQYQKIDYEIFTAFAVSSSSRAMQTTTSIIEPMDMELIFDNIITLCILYIEYMDYFRFDFNRQKKK